MITVPFIVSGFALALLTQFVKDKIMPKYGGTGVHVFMFCIAVLGIITVGLYTTFPSVKVIIEEGLTMLGTAITLYEVLLSKIGFSA